ERTDGQRQLDDPGKAWRQLVRWLIADVPGLIDVRIAHQEERGQPMTRVESRIHDREFQSLDNASVTITVKQPDGSKLTQPAEPSLKEPGLYEASFSSRAGGQYRVEVDAVDADGKSVGHVETGWAANPEADEFHSVVPNQPLLSDIAKKTGGEIVSVEDLESFVATLPNRKVPKTETYTQPLWHQPWVLLTIVIGLCWEWGLRRYRGLP
ncbi:MAG: hypothetical protein FJ267_14720, partial [Planctomycetes bacterium]|nr:hypothetical protein [Planctomycetota bacterium]